MILQIPLAWLQLSWQRVRFIAALAGVVFIIVLLFLQLGFQDALYNSATQVHQVLRGDLFLISSQYNSLTSQQSFPRARLYQTLGFAGVDSVSPLYMQFGKFKNPETGNKFSIYLLGIDPATSVFNLPEVEQNLNVLKNPNRVLYDRASRPEFGPIAEEFNQGESVSLEIFPFNEPTGYRVEVGGLFSLGPSFGVDGNLVVNYLTLLRIFQNRRPGDIDVGAIMLKPGADLQKVRSNLADNLPDDIRVFTQEEFIDFEKNYWATRTSLGFTFGLSVTMAFVIGTAIIYQILYTNISNHIAEYATLKAMGFRNKYLLGVVFQQALILSVIGYIIGFFIAVYLFNLAKDATKLPVVMTISTAITVLISAILMCSFSGVISINKLRSADPADIF
jgi:putative ABC transport system permease protein